MNWPRWNGPVSWTLCCSLLNMTVRVAILQMTSGIDPAANAATIAQACVAAKEGGAAVLTTPEMALFLDRNRQRAAAHIPTQADSAVLRECQDAAARAGIWLHIGSMPLRDEASDKSVNRAFLIAPDGAIAAHYDKIHLFDVELATGESWMESRAYQAGSRAVLVDTPLGRIGLAICYDLRFPALFDTLGAARPDLILSPAAFTVPTGEAHWHLLTRARAVESGCFLIAAAQVGQHEDGRATYGHSVAVGPWGDVLLDMGHAPGLAFVDLDFAENAKVRGQIPGLGNRRDIAPPVIIKAMGSA